MERSNPFTTIAGWWLGAGRPELRVADHRLAILANPGMFGIDTDAIDRVGRGNRVALLKLAMAAGWVRVRVAPTRGMEIHIEMDRLDGARLQRIESWRRRHRVHRETRVIVGIIAAGQRIERVGKLSTLVGGDGADRDDAIHQIPAFRDLRPGRRERETTRVRRT